VAQQANFVQESVDRVREAVASIEDDIEHVQKRMQKEWKVRRKAIEKHVKRAQGAVDDATKQFEQGVDNVLKVLHVASQRDLSRIDRKLNQINRKLRDLEKPKQGNGSAEAN
jgi:septation ring formation regulator EzrA